MNMTKRDHTHRYFPAVAFAEHDSPIDALVGACVPRAEAMDLVAASWIDGETDALLATLDGGRPIVILRTGNGRWAVCQAFLDEQCATSEEAGQRLARRLKRRERGYVASLPGAWMIREEAQGAVSHEPMGFVPTKSGAK